MDLERSSVVILDYIEVLGAIHVDIQNTFIISSSVDA